MKNMGMCRKEDIEEEEKEPMQNRENMKKIINDE